VYSGIDMPYRIRYTDFSSSSDPGASRVSLDD
jgi:hypothetical protein